MKKSTLLVDHEIKKNLKIYSLKMGFTLKETTDKALLFFMSENNFEIEITDRNKNITFKKEKNLDKKTKYFNQ